MMAGMRLTLGALWLLAALVVGWQGLQAVTAAAPLAATCTPRPAVTVAVAPAGAGTLRATITAATAAGVTLQQVGFGTLTNALVDIPGRPPGDAQPAPIDVAGQASTTFTFRQATTTQAATIPLTVVDSCGTWPTFVGGGPTAFAGSTPTPTPPLGPTATRTRTPTASPTVKAGAIVTADLSASQQVIGGQVITVYWSGIANAGTKDQIGLYRTADTQPQSNRLDTPLFTGGTASGNANVAIPNSVLLAGSASDTFQFILYHADASAATPVFVTQSHTFTIVANTVALVPPTPSPADAPGARPRGAKATGGAGAKATAAGSKSAAARAPAPARVPARARGTSPDMALASPPGPAPTPVAGNDSFAAAYTLGKLPAKLTESTAAAITESGEPLTCGGVPFSKTVWYKVTPAAGTLTVDTYGSDFDTVLAVYTGNAVNALTLVACNDESPPTHQSVVTFNTTGSTTYYVQVGGYAGASGNAIVHFARGAPSNNSFASAIPLSLGAQVPAFTDSAGSEPVEPTIVSCTDDPAFPPCPQAEAGIGQTVWYSYTAGAATTLVTIDTVGSNFDTVLAVYTGTAIPNLLLLTYDDDLAPGTQQSRVTILAQAFNTYYVQVGGFADPNPSGGGTLGPTDAGTLVVRIYATPPEPNNDFASAITVAVPTRVTALNAVATVQSGEPMTSGGTSICDAAQVSRTLWYKFQPASGTVVTLDTFGSNYDTVLAVYTGSAVNALTQVDCNDDSGGVRASQISFTADGSLYYIQVGGFYSLSAQYQFGNLVLNVGTTPNDSFATSYEVLGMGAGISGLLRQVTDSASTEGGEPTSCGGVSFGKTVWYRFTLKVPGTVAIDTYTIENSDFDTVLAVYTSSNGTLGGLSLATCNDDAAGAGLGRSRVQFTANPFTTYYVQAGGKISGGPATSGYLGMNFSFLPPANDNRANAIDVFDSVAHPGPFPKVFSAATEGATAEPGEPGTTAPAPPSCVSAPIGRTVWYRLSNSVNTTVAITTKFSNFDRMIVAYLWNGSTLTEVGCVDNSFGTAQSPLTLNMTANQQYYVQVGGTHAEQFFGANFGNLYVTFLTDPPPNDSFASALAVPPGMQQRRTFTGTATTEPGEPLANVCDGVIRPTGKTVWYTYAAPTSGTATINTFGSDFDTVLAVYTGSAVNALTLRACNDDSMLTQQSQVSFAATAGTTYRVQVGGYGGIAGTLVVNFP
jgi:hypothetical protein